MGRMSRKSSRLAFNFRRAGDKGKKREYNEAPYLVKSSGEKVKFVSRLERAEIRGGSRRSKYRIARGWKQPITQYEIEGIWEILRWVDENILRSFASIFTNNDFYPLNLWGYLRIFSDNRLLFLIFLGILLYLVPISTLFQIGTVCAFLGFIYWIFDNVYN